MRVTLRGIDYIRINPARERDVHGSRRLIGKKLELGEGLDMAADIKQKRNETKQSKKIVLETHVLNYLNIKGSKVAEKKLKVTAHSLVEFEGMADVDGLYRPIQYVLKESIRLRPAPLQRFLERNQHLHPPHAVTPCDVDVEAGLIGQAVEITHCKLARDFDQHTFSTPEIYKILNSIMIPPYSVLDFYTILALGVRAFLIRQP